MYKRARTVLAGAVAAAAVLSIVAASPVAAARLTIVDGTGDVWRFDDITTGEYLPAPRVSDGDFTSATFRHRVRRVVIRSTFVELRRGHFALDGRMRDQNGSYRFFLEATGQNRQGLVWFWDAERRAIPCRVARKIDYEDNSIRISFPRACLGDPHYLRFRIELANYAVDKYVDNPHNETPQATWTRRVWRG